VPNMKDVSDKPRNQRVLLVGGAGAGKTTQAWTLPGRVFAYVFDPNAEATLAGADIDYEAFQPDIQDLDLSVKTLKRDVGDKSIRAPTPQTYTDWEADFEARLEKGFFDAYDWLVFDSATTFSDAVMDRVLWLNKRLGKMPEYDDYSSQMTTIQNVFRVCANLNINFLATGHVELRQDETSKKIYGHIMFTGRLRTRLPLLFTNIWACYCDSNEESEFYGIQTRPDRINPVIRTTVRDLKMYEDVTIRNWSHPKSYGIGRILSGKTPAKKAA